MAADGDSAVGARKLPSHLAVTQWLAITCVMAALFGSAISSTGKDAHTGS